MPLGGLGSVSVSYGIEPEVNHRKVIPFLFLRESKTPIREGRLRTLWGAGIILPKSTLKSLALNLIEIQKNHRYTNKTTLLDSQEMSDTKNTS